jgi:hypothetical protein
MIWNDYLRQCLVETMTWCELIRKSVSSGLATQPGEFLLNFIAVDSWRREDREISIASHIGQRFEAGNQ